MISALKRLVTSDNNASSSNPQNGATNSSSQSNAPSPNKSNNALSTTSLINNGMQMISQSLQKKFSKGVNYNMKIVIRGDCNTGKTCLWLRLQGQPFKEAYETSEEIKVANIQWSYKSNDDIVKVEIWDVVDRSKKKRNLLQQQQQRVTSSNALKLDNEASAASKMPVEASLDAEFIDVYKNANGCILVYDITKQWTWEYIERELPKIPTHIPVLIIGNHRDMHHHRTVDELKCKFFLENLSRGSLGTAVRYTETSMRTGFGLKYLYKFFNIPFLQLQRENLMQQLEINAKETDAFCEELQQMEENIEDEYDDFSQNLNSKRRQQQEENAKDVLKNAKTIDEARRSAQEKEAVAAAAQEAANAQLSEPKKVINSIINKINTKVIQPNTSAPTSISMSVTLDPNSKIKSLQNISNSTSLNNFTSNGTGSKSPINFQLDDFPHDDELNKFLDDPFKPSSSGSTHINSKTDDEDDDANANNPMVAAFKDTIDSSDEDSTKNKMSKITIKQADLSDNDDEDEDNKSSLMTALAHKQEAKQQGEFVFVNNTLSSHNSTSSGQGSTTMASNQNNLDSLSATTSISMMNYDSTSQMSNSLPVQDDQANNFKLTNDDFEFLENMSLNEKISKKSSKKSNKNDEIKTKKKKSKASKESNDELLENGNDGSSEKEKKEKEKKKSKKSSSSKSSKKQSGYDVEDDVDERSSISIKRDVDYEEL